ncbi:Uncharacterised protein [Yersinia kristensenii]|nr:hypothetical protein ykris0001_10640 [Yersinia kristensenii ATCC 33638]SUP67462.1 Uncharacterised protein [Yersinia kristensenii]
MDDIVAINEAETADNACFCINKKPMPKIIGVAGRQQAN